MQKRAFITGGTGFLGQHLLKLLVSEGWQITAVHRSALPTTLRQLPQVCWIKASLQDPNALLQAMPEEPFYLFHLAADTAQWPPLFERQTQTNVEGTRNILAAAKQKPVTKMVHTSTVAAFGAVSALISERTESTAKNSKQNYARTKWHAEQLVKEAVAKNAIDAVILNPSHIIGPGDTHNWIQLFTALIDNNLPAIPPATGNFGYAPNIAKAHLNAAKFGKNGENYILGGAHHSFLELVVEIQRQLGLPLAKKASPAWLLHTIEPLMRLGSYITRKEPQLTADKVQLLTHHLQVDDSKARNELGYTHETLSYMVETTLKWLKTQS